MAIQPYVRADAPRIRLYVEDGLAEGTSIGAGKSQAHYLTNVMRLAAGDAVALFNGRDGEWRARIAEAGRKGCTLAVEAQLRPQTAGPDLWLVFAPIKRAPIDFVAAKATELGVSGLRPVLTARTNVSRVNLDRLHANVVEAAEQCDRLDLPEIAAPVTFDALIAGWPAARRILLCDETLAAEGGGAHDIVNALGRLAGQGEPGPWAVMIGPEGGFAPTELDALRKLPFVTAVRLGPRLLRADTAALAAVACWQARLGDWRGLED